MTDIDTQHGGQDAGGSELSADAAEARRRYYRRYYREHRDQIAENQRRYMKKYRKTKLYKDSQARYWERRAQREKEEGGCNDSEAQQEK